MELGDVLMLILTALSVMVSVGSLEVARRSRDQAGAAVMTAKDANSVAREANRIATEGNAVAKAAGDLAEAAPTEMAWDSALDALTELSGVSPSMNQESFRPYMLRTRAALRRLVDRLQWSGFDEWVTAEYGWVVALMREALEKGQTKSNLTPDEVMRLDEHFHRWNVVFSQNLRQFRNEGLNAKVLSALTDIAEQRRTGVHNRNGWPIPPESPPGITQLGA